MEFPFADDVAGFRLWTLTSCQLQLIVGYPLITPRLFQGYFYVLPEDLTFVASPNFAEAAQNLVDALVENGFNRQEAEDFIKPIEVKEPSLLFQSVNYELPPKIILLPEVPDPEKLPLVLQNKVTIDPDKKTITLKKILYPDEIKAIEDILSKDEARGKWSYEANRHREEVKKVFKSPSEQGSLFRSLFCASNGVKSSSFLRRIISSKKAGI